MSRRLFWMVVILLVAAAFRFLALDAAPPGWRDDELIEFGVDTRIRDGWRPLFITEAEGHEPFYHYLHAGTLALFGENIVGYKWLPFAFGVISVALTYALARRMFDARVGLLAAALMAVSFWPIMYARLGLRHIGVVPLMLGAFYAIFPRPSLSPPRFAGGMIGGGLIAAALMTYFAGRAVPIILIGFLAYLFIFNRTVLRRVWIGVVGAIVIGALLAAPMFIEIRNTPGAEARTEVVGGPLIAAMRGDLQPAIATTLGTLGMFTFAGDPESLYNIPGRPVFDWLTGIAFYLGVLICLIRLKRVASGFALVWLIVGIAPAFVSVPAASFSHTIAAQPVIYMLAALGLVEVAHRIEGEKGRRGEEEFSRFPLLPLSLSPLLLVALSVVLLNAGLAIHDYFGAWATDGFVRFQYHGPTRDIARWLDQNPDMTDVAIGTHFTQFDLDPMALNLDLVRADVSVRWFSAEAALVFPHEGVVLVSPMQIPARDIESLLSTEAELLQPIIDAGGQLSIRVYRHTPPMLGVIPPQGNTLDGSLLLRMARAPIDAVQAGGAIVWQTVWQVEKPIAQSRLKMFLHVLDGRDQVIAGDDREDVKVSSLQTGDVVWQINTVTLPADLTPGAYPVEVGWYDPTTEVRLRLPDGGDRLLLDPIEVTAP